MFVSMEDCSGDDLIIIEEVGVDANNWIRYRATAKGTPSFEGFGSSGCQAIRQLVHAMAAHIGKP